MRSNSSPRAVSMITGMPEFSRIERHRESPSSPGIMMSSTTRSMALLFITLRALAASWAVVGLCPLTESSLGDGIFDGASYLAVGGCFGIGTDSNIQIDAAAELRQLEYEQRLARRARNVMTMQEGESTGRRLLDSARVGGAQALQRPVDALTAGLRADIVLLDKQHPDLASRHGDEWLNAWIFVVGLRAVKRCSSAERSS